MSNKLYDILKIASMVVLPFCAMVAAIITAIQSGPDASHIILAIGEAVATFLGVLLTVSTKAYWKAQTEQIDNAEG